MKLNWKFVTTAAFAVCTCSLMLLGSALPLLRPSRVFFQRSIRPFEQRFELRCRREFARTILLQLPAASPIPQPSPASPARTLPWSD